MEQSWDTLTPDEKMERRFAAWLSTEGMEFDSAKAEAAYKARLQRHADALQLKTPDRVPVTIQMGSFAARYAGYTQQDMMYDADKAVDAAIKSTLDFDPDMMSLAGGSSGRALEMIDFKLYDWPGHGVGPENGIQFKEGEYMKPEEYDALIDDPSDFWQRTYLPRIIGAFQPFTALMPFSSVIEIVNVPAHIARYADPAVQAAFQKLFAAGQEVVNWQQKSIPAMRKLQRLGYPGGGGGFTLTPFDALGDTLRGTRGIITDMFKRPEKLLQALERMTPLMIRMGLSGARMGGAPVVGIPLHKGADGWMSEEQFKTFYWPYLLKVIQGLNAEGMIVRPFAEGGYNTRLETIRPDLAKGKTSWHFDRTDMAKAKEVLGDVACIQGNVPAALIHTGSVDDVVACCKDLIDTAGKGGGFVLTTGAGIDQNAKAENVHAMIRCAKEYGVYN